MQIMLKKDGKETGPFTRDEVSIMLNDGRITRTDFAFHEGLSNWLPITAVLVPRATPPPFKERPESFDSVRVKPNETFANIVSQTSSLDWKNIVPYKTILNDKSWNLRWVRWVLWFAGSLFLIQHMSDDNDLSSDQAVFLLAMNWMLAWAVAFSFIIKPGTIQAAKLASLILPSVGLMVVLFVIAGKIQFLNSLYQATSDYSLFKRMAASLTTAIIHQSILAVPFAYAYIKKKQQDSPTTIIYYGLLAGFVAGLIPALVNLIQRKWYSLAGHSLGIYEKQSLLLVLSFPVLAGIWGAIMGHFIVEAKRDHGAVFGWTVAAILIPAIFAAVFLVSSSLIISLLVIVVSVFSLSAYLKTHKES